jgi:16S rRNA G966 N2-methylase RsmD
MKDLVREFLYQVFDNYQEKRLGVETAEIARLKNLGINRMDSHDYLPIAYYAIYSILRKIPLPKWKGVFLDYGAGKGRAVVAAAQFPFKKVIGVEISKELTNMAKLNIAKLKHKKTKCIEVHSINAADFVVPEEVNIIYFYNPFKDKVLQKTVNNIHFSFNRYPRKIFIVFFKDALFEKIVENEDWIEKKYQKEYYPYMECGVYETLVA